MVTTTYIEKQTVLPSHLVEDSLVLLNLHNRATAPVYATRALGIGDFARQDRENISILGGEASFDVLRLIQDAEPAEKGVPNDLAVNYRTFQNLLESSNLGNAAPNYPFTKTGQPQVLVAQTSQLGYSAAPSSFDPILTWQTDSGPVFAPPYSSSSTPLNPQYVFGHQSVVIGVGDMSGFLEGPAAPYLQFPTITDLSTWAADKTFFGNLYVYVLKGVINGELRVPTQAPPFFVQLIVRRDPDPTVNDVLIIKDTRVFFDTAEGATSYALHSPLVRLTNCELDPRSVLCVNFQGVRKDTGISINGCRGTLLINGGPSSTIGPETISITDSQLELQIGSNEAPAVNRYRDVSIRGSMVRLADMVDTLPVSVNHPLKLRTRDSLVAATSIALQQETDYWTLGTEENFAYSRGPALYVVANTSHLVLSHLVASKPAWPSNLDATINPPVASPVVMARASWVTVLNIGDQGDQDLLTHTYRPPVISASQSVLVSGTAGSRLVIGLDKQVLGTVTTGLYLDRLAITGAFGPIAFTPIALDSTSYGALTNRRDSVYANGSPEDLVTSLPAAMQQLHTDVAGASL